MVVVNKQYPTKSVWSYQTAMDYLNSFIDFERIPEPRLKTTEDDIVRFKDLLKRLGNPHLSYPIVHIVGTKGKGSTSAMLASILKSAGYRVGLYTSPHLISVRERIQVNGRCISKRDFSRLLQTINKQFDNSDNSQLAFRTVFEHLTAAGFLHFARNKVDIAIIEAGLGAKLDATIVVEPTLTVITPIGLDHTNVLGNTVAEISTDKAYAIKHRVITISAQQIPDAKNAITKRAKEAKSKLVFAPNCNSVDIIKSSLSGTELQHSDRIFGVNKFKIKLAGLFQVDNFLIVLTTLKELQKKGFICDVNSIKKGMVSVRWPGRLQVIPGNPEIIIDGAHNQLAAIMLTSSLTEIAPGKKWHIVFSSIKGKPIAEMLSSLKPIMDRLFLAPLVFPKGLRENELREAATLANVNATICKNVESALEQAIKSCKKPSDSVLVTGSLYLVSEVLLHLKGLPPPPSDGRINPSV